MAEEKTLKSNKQKLKNIVVLSALFFIWVLHTGFQPFKTNSKVIAIEQYIDSKNLGKMCGEAEQQFELMTISPTYSMEFAKEIENLSNKLSEAEIEAGQMEFEKGNYKLLESCKYTVGHRDKSKALPFFEDKLNEIKIKQEEAIVEAKKQATDEWDKISKMQFNSFSDARQTLRDFISKYRNSQIDIGKIDSEINSMDFTEKEMNRSWDYATSQNTLKAYQDFLERFEKDRFSALNPHMAKAQRAIDEIKGKIEIDRKSAYNSAQQKNTIEGYDDFIRTYPGSVEAAEAKKLLAKLKEEHENKVQSEIVRKRALEAEQEKKILRERALKEFSEAKAEIERYKMNNMSYGTYRLEQFVRDYPKSDKVGEANELIATFKKMEAEEQRKSEEKASKEKQEWETIIKKNSIEALDKFIKGNPNSPYANEATVMKHRLTIDKVKKTQCNNGRIQLISATWDGGTRGKLG